MFINFSSTITFKKIVLKGRWGEKFEFYQNFVFGNQEKLTRFKAAPVFGKKNMR